MGADVCPVSRYRCTTLAACTEGSCWRQSSSSNMKPISETRLSKKEQYWLAMADKRAAQEKSDV